MSLKIVYERDGSRTFHVDGKEVTEEDAERLHPTKPGFPMFNRAVDQGWELENNGKGRFIGQLGAVDDPNAYVSSRSQIPERAKRAGFQKIEKC